MRNPYANACLVGLAAAIVMFSNLGGPQLWDRDEPRNAGCAAEMLSRGDWVVPVFNAELRTHKPVLLYWLMMASYALFGVNEFAARFPSAVMAVGTALCTYAIGQRLFSPRAGLCGGLAIASCLMFAVAGRAATPDSALIFFSALALTVYVLGAFKPGGAESMDEGRLHFPAWPTAAVMYLVMGLGVLAKGPVGLVLPTAVIGMFLLIMRLPEPPSHRSGRWKRLFHALRVAEPRHFLATCWSMRPVTAIGAVLLVALPWYYWVGVRTDGVFLREFFLEHNVGRATTTLEGHSGPPLLFYAGAILVGFFPWSVFAVPLTIDAVASARRESRYRAAYVLLACWIGVYVGIFSLAQTKLPSYVTPCYPAVAVLAGGFLDRWIAGVALPSRWWPRLALGSLGTVGLGLVIGLPIAASIILPGEEWLAAIGLLPLVGAGVCLVLSERQRVGQAVGVFSLAAVVTITCAFGGIAARVSSHQEHGRLLTRAKLDDTPRIASFGLLEPSWIFYSQQPIDELSTEARELTSSWIEVDGKWVRKPPIHVDEHLARPGDNFILTTRHHLDALEKLLPPGYGVVDEVPYFLRDEQLVLVGPESNARTATRTDRDGSAVPRSR